jgi:hypothetical protein
MILGKWVYIRFINRWSICLQFRFYELVTYLVASFKKFDLVVVAIIFGLRHFYLKVYIPTGVSDSTRKNLLPKVLVPILQNFQDILLLTFLPESVHYYIQQKQFLFRFPQPLNHFCYSNSEYLGLFRSQIIFFSKRSFFSVVLAIMLIFTSFWRLRLSAFG